MKALIRKSTSKFSWTGVALSLILLGGVGVTGAIWCSGLPAHPPNVRTAAAHVSCDSRALVE